MDNIQIIEVETLEGTQRHVIIDRGNNEFTSMPEAEYLKWKEEQWPLKSLPIQP